MTRPMEPNNIAYERLACMTDRFLTDARQLRCRMDRLLRCLYESRCSTDQDVEDCWQCAT